MRSKPVDVVSATFSLTVGEDLVACDFRKSRAGRWRRGDLQVRLLRDAKAVDPYAGGAFSVEFERAPDGKFEWKLTGRVRFFSLLTDVQRESVLKLRNSLVERFPRPPSEHLALYPSDLREQYLSVFHRVEGLPEDFWMPFRNNEEVHQWCRLLRGFLPDLVDRASTLDPGGMVMGMRHPGTLP